MRYSMFLLAMMTAGGMVSAQDTTVQTEKYRWDSVTIKANGFINGIVFHPLQPGLVYINTDMGGAYRFDQADGLWRCLTDWVSWDDWSLNYMGVETLAIDPSDVNRVYIGMGTYMGPSAILRSTDQGRTWQRTNVPFVMDGNGSARNSGQRMMVDPHMPSRLLYGTRNRGLWISEDFGESWSRLEAFPAVGEDQGAARNAGVTWVLFDQSSGTAGEATPVVYAGVMVMADQKVFRSLDAGTTWSAIPGQPGGDLLPTRAALTPDGTTMYLTYIVGDNFPGPHGIVGGAVYRLDSPAGDSPVWRDISPSRGRFGWSGIAIDPTDPQTILTSVICRWAPVDDIYRSRDGGMTWHGLNTNANRDDSSAPYARHMEIHWVGDVQIDPNNPQRAMFTTGFGLYDTRNLNADEPSWVFFNEGFEQSAVLELVSPPVGDVYLISAIGDRDGYIHEDFTQSPRLGHHGSLQRRWIGSCYDIDLAWHNPQVMARLGARAQYSLDAGVTWNFFPTEPPSGRRGTIAIPAGGDRVLLSNSEGTFVTVLQGQAWSEWRTLDSAPTGARLLADRVNPTRVYAVVGQVMYQSLDAGETWQRQTDQMPENRRSLRAVFGHEGHLWLAAQNNGLYRSVDGGASWQAIATNIIQNANLIGIGAPPSPGQYPAVFVSGTIGGLRGYFRSDDQGQTWVRINDDANQFGSVTVIQGDSRVHGRLYVGSNGRGILFGQPVVSTD